MVLVKATADCKRCGKELDLLKLNHIRKGADHPFKIVFGYACGACVKEDVAGWL